MSLISIIIPIYNAEEYLNRTINSLINQTIGIENLEVILVNDCSTDSTKEIIDEYCKKYPNFVPFHLKKNVGAGEAQNIGIKNASSKYTMILGADDEYVEDMCETLYNTIEENNVDTVMCNFLLVYPTKTVKAYILDKNIDKKIINPKKDPLRPVSPCNKIHNTKLLTENNVYFKNRIAEDMYFTSLEYLFIDSILVLNNYFGYKYYQSDNSTSKTPTMQNFTEILKTYHDVTDILRKHKQEEMLNYRLRTQMTGYYFRLILFKGTYKEYKIILKKLYDFEKYYGKPLKMESFIYRIANFFLLKKQFFIIICIFKILPIIRNIYKKIKGQ